MSRSLVHFQGGHFQGICFNHNKFSDMVYFRPVDEVQIIIRLTLIILPHIWPNMTYDSYPNSVQICIVLSTSLLIGVTFSIYKLHFYFVSKLNLSSMLVSQGNTTLEQAEN